MPSHSKEPIAAIATAPGRGGIGIVRVSGPDLDELVRALFDDMLAPRKAHYRPFNDRHGEAIDAGVALYFKSPHSYTGEDVLELQGHGGTAVLRRLLERCLEAGASLGIRHARPGEFTERAFLNERLDLAQAEAVADLIDASSTAAARSAMASLSGVFSTRVNALAERIINLRMLVEATLDFPEEEIDFLRSYQAREKLTDIRSDLDTIIRQTRQSMALREGLYVVLAGQPNVGKSSLLNALAGDDIAIVTPIAGTTRDKVTQQIHIDGVPIHIVDTAGLRETDDTVERLGMERTWAELEKANVILHMQDVGRRNDALDTAIVQRLPKGIPVLAVLNKIDLAQKPEPPAAGSNELHISAKTGVGLDELKRRLLEVAGRDPGMESPWLARERHLLALNNAGEHLALADEHAGHNDQVLDLFAEELRLAHGDLCAITGQFTSDDLLGEIFSRFCIGK
ncbi:MAG TPA: tRNA uridine-5-carboxymethylaminomethyl(34) synthesis GTPase MnmE [Burkholderiaceae bacterium]|nr:tRNA uridine-5-carboxymethylaminomethyl(34) synthesis GTPase MnmE [Burkholderiaceae bacterium]